MKLANGVVLNRQEVGERFSRQYHALLKHNRMGRCAHPYEIPVNKWPTALRDADKVSAAEDDADPETPQGLDDTPDPEGSTPAATPVGDSALERPASMTQAFKGLDRFSPNPSKSHEPLTAFRK